MFKSGSKVVLLVAVLLALIAILPVQAQSPAPKAYVGDFKGNTVDVIDVDALVHGDDALCGNAVLNQHLPDRFRRGHEPIDLSTRG